VLDDSLGIRHSHPFLDPRFIQATYGLDPWWPMRGGHYRALEEAAFCDRLPPAVSTRRSKAEFSEVFWSQVLDAGALDSVLAGPLQQAGWLQDSGVSDLLRRAQDGRSDAAQPLSRCIALDRWLRLR